MPSMVKQRKTHAWYVMLIGKKNDYTYSGTIIKIITLEKNEFYFFH